MSKKTDLTVAVDVQGLDEFLNTFKQMGAAVDELCNKLERLGTFGRMLRKTFNVTNNYHLTCFSNSDREDECQP